MPPAQQSAAGGFSQLARLGDQPPEIALRTLLAGGASITLRARVPQPKRKNSETAGDGAATVGPEGPARVEAAAGSLPAEGAPPDSIDDPHRSAAERAWTEQNALLAKLHVVAEDARTYEQDTGVHVLNIGFPLLSMPPGSFAASSGSASRRILAPIAFIPVSVTIKRGSVRGVEIACRGEGVDRVTPNAALFSWLDQQAGKGAVTASDLFADGDGADPWREIAGLTRLVCKTLDIATPDLFVERPAAATQPSAPLPTNAPGSIPAPNGADQPPAPAVGSTDGASSPAAAALKLSPAPRADEASDAPAVLMSAILGLFPMANQGLLRDMQEMAAQESQTGPVESFVRLGVTLDLSPAAIEGGPPATVEPRGRDFSDERLIASADPCQSRAVRLARQTRGLVIHGPPGTGKSQTITNIIGDHLARGERVLLVCEKRTALDVVANRLEAMGLRSLVAIVHDPRRDQRELYRELRQQLEDLPEARVEEQAEARLQKTDVALQRLHAELTAYHAALTRHDEATGASFHELVGRWLASAPASAADALKLDPATIKRLAGVRLVDFDAVEHGVHEMLRRAALVGWSTHPWRQPVGIQLSRFLSQPADLHRTALAACVEAAKAADDSIDPRVIPFDPGIDLARQAEARRDLAQRAAALFGAYRPPALGHWATRDELAAQGAGPGWWKPRPTFTCFGPRRSTPNWPSS